MASKKMKVPSLIHEQNVYPGMTVKGSANYVTYLALSFEETINHMQHKEKCVCAYFRRQFGCGQN